MSEANHESHERPKTQVDSLVLGAGTALVTAGATLTVNSALPGISLILIGLMLMGFAIVPHLPGVRRRNASQQASEGEPVNPVNADPADTPPHRPIRFSTRLIGMFLLVSIIGSLSGGGVAYYVLRSTAAGSLAQAPTAITCANGSLERNSQPSALVDAAPVLATFRMNTARTGSVSEEGPVREVRLEKLLPVSGMISGAASISEGIAYVGTSNGLVYALPVQGEGAEPKWVFQTNGAVYSSPTLANGAVYVTSQDGCVYALDALSGQPFWTSNLGLPTSSSPAVVDQRLFVGAGKTDSPRGALHAIDALSGKTLWTYETRAAVFSPPSIVDGVVFFGVWSKHGDSVIALDAATGEKKWSFAAGDEVVGAVAVHDGAVYFGAYDGHVYALYAGTGVEKWRAMAWDGGNTFDGNKLVYASPAVSGETLYVSSFSGNLYAFDLDDGNTLWETSISTLDDRADGGNRPRSSPLSAKNAVYVGGSSGHIYAFDPKTGEELWKLQTEGPVSSSPVLVDGIVYIGVVNDDGTLIALSGDSG